MTHYWKYFVRSIILKKTIFCRGYVLILGLMVGKQPFSSKILWEVLAICVATVYKGNIIKNLIMDCQSYTKYRPNETTGGIFVSWRRKEELPTGA